jgi:hypothetical protein
VVGGRNWVLILTHTVLPSRLVKSPSLVSQAVTGQKGGSKGASGNQSTPNLWPHIRESHVTGCDAVTRAENKPFPMSQAKRPSPSDSL